MAVTQQRPRVTGAARRTAALLALLTLAGSWTGTAGAPNAAALTPSPALVAIDGGAANTCALVTDGTIRCWGANSGSLGNGSVLNSIVPVAVTGISNAAGIAVGAGHACAVLAAGAVRCWGQNEFGQLGNGTNAGSSLPVAVLGIASATAVTAGSDHACALLAAGTVACWGSGGTIGDGSWSSRSAPVPVLGVDDAVAIAAGAAHTCALRATGEVACWGVGDAGQLGDGTLDRGLIPTAVAGLMDATSIAAGGDQSCAMRSSGGVSCWGATNPLVYGGYRPIHSLPQPVEGIADALQVEVTASGACARLADGTARCWGDNASGTLGDGTKTNSDAPVAVSGLGDATTLGTGWAHVCAVIADQSAVCWGENGSGQLGDRTVTDRTTPVAVRWDPDTTAPIVTGFRFELIDRREARTTAYRIIVRYPASDGPAGTGIDHVIVERSINGGAWENVPHPSVYGAKTTIRTTGSFRVRVRAYDRAGNLGPWRTSDETRVRLVQDTASSVVYDGAWTVRRHDRLLDGSSRFTRIAGASVSYRFTGWAIGFITVTSRYRGEVDVYLDGNFVSRFDTSMQAAFRQLVDETHWNDRAAHTVTFVAVGTAGRPRIDFDALVVIR
jgi:alpha-tubulin suppressor-like RCC1 family protein